MLNPQQACKGSNRDMGDNDSSVLFIIKFELSSNSRNPQIREIKNIDEKISFKTA
jgi:hypothetical protein